MKHLTICLLLLLISSVPSFGQDKPNQEYEEWLTYELGEANGVVFKLRVKKYACFADTCWIGFEFENNAEDSIFINGTVHSYNIEYKTKYSSSTLVSGQFYSFEPISRFGYPFVPKGNSKLDLSGSAAISLYIPSNKDTFPVNCNMHFSFPFIGKESFEIKDFEFTFNWYYPDDAQFDYLTSDLKRILNEGRKNDFYYLSRLLKTDRVADSVPLQVFLDNLEKFAPNDWSTDLSCILEYIDRKYANDPAVFSYYDQWIDRDMPTAIDRTLKHKNLSFHYQDTIFAYYKTRIKDHFIRMNIQTFHLGYIRIYYEDRGEPPETMKALRNRYLEALIEAFPVLIADPETLSDDELLQWTSLCNDLRQLADSSFIPCVMPFLYSQKRVSSERELDSYFNYRIIRNSQGRLDPPKVRVCDFALELIYSLRNESISPYYEPAIPDENGRRVFRVKTSEDAKAFLNQVTGIRDRLIEALLEDKVFDK